MSEDRQATVTAKGIDDVFGTIPWIAVVPRGKRTAPYGAVTKKKIVSIYCRSNAGYFYVDKDGIIYPVCFSHLHTKHLETEVEQKRLIAWMKRTGQSLDDENATGALSE